jgi:hypothetical protein
MAKEKSQTVMASEEPHVEFAVGHPDLADSTSWWKQTMLRRLYFMMPLLFLGSTTLGYDGSLLNGLQTMPSWQNCKSCWVLQGSSTDTCPRFRSSHRIITRHLRRHAWLWRPRRALVRSLHRRLPRAAKRHRSRLSVRPVGSPPTSFPSCREPESHVPGGSFLYWLWKQHQQRNLPLIDHRDRTSKASRKGDDIVQHTVVPWCNRRGLDFIRNLDDSNRQYPMASAHRSPVLDARHPASRSLLLPGITTLVDKQRKRR